VKTFINLLEELKIAAQNHSKISDVLEFFAHKNRAIAFGYCYVLLKHVYENQWRPAKDGHPLEGISVICRVGDAHVVCFRRGSSWINEWTGSTLPDISVSHWAEIPPPNKT